MSATFSYSKTWQMLHFPNRTCASVGGRHESSSLSHLPPAAKGLGWGPAHSFQGAPSCRPTAPGRLSIITTATAGSPEDAGVPPLPRRQATLRPRTLRASTSAPASAPAPPPQHPPPPPPPSATAVGGPRVAATAVRPTSREAGGPTREAGGPAGTAAEAVRVLSPAAARLQHRDLQPRREQPAGQQPATPHPHPHPHHQQQQNRPTPGADRSLNPRQAGFALRTGLALTFLGTNSGAPTLERNVSCTLVRLPGVVHMVDCGEGTQRQLMTLGGALDPAEVDGIFITHLHGDHCFGLPAALALLDEAKAARQADPARRRHHVYGPPGLAELIRVSMVTTGLTRRLQLPLLVSELVNSPASAHPPMPLAEAQQHHHSRGERGRQQQQRGRGQQQATLVRDLEGAGSGRVTVLVQRLAAQRVQDARELRAAVEAVQPRVAALEEIWSPPPRYPAPGQYGQYGRSSYSGSDNDAAEPSSSGDDGADESAGGGTGAAPAIHRPFVAAEGLFWEFSDCAGVRVRAAQLQHRVPCWGYVFTEAQPHEQGARRRKVAVLGDTVSSRPIAPLAAGCDVLSHEATFARGMEAKARIAQHSTGWMAGAFAAAVGARNLVLTHFSARYRDGPRDLEFGRTSSRATGHLEAEQQSWAVAGLMQEAASTYGRSEHLFAASDFFTFHVPPRFPAAAVPTATATTSNA